MNHVEGGFLYDGRKVPIGVAYNTKASIQYTFVPKNRAGKPVKYEGGLEVVISGHDGHFDFIDPIEEIAAEGLRETANGKERVLQGAREVSENDPLVITIRINERRLSMPPSPQDKALEKEYKLADSVLKSIDFKGKPLDDLTAFLEWIRENVKYLRDELWMPDRSVDDIIKQKHACCGHFAVPLSYFLRRAGHYARRAGLYVFNIEVEGMPLFPSIGLGQIGVHGWNEIFDGTGWKHVDPRLYEAFPNSLGLRALDRGIEAYFLPLPTGIEVRYLDGPREFRNGFSGLVDFKIIKTPQTRQAALSSLSS